MVGGLVLAGGQGPLTNRIFRVGHLGSVMATLSAPRTDLPSFFKELGDAARIVAPVSKTNAHLFTTMANTFEAISRDPQALKSTISESPPTLRAGTESLRVQRPFLEHSAALSRDLDAAPLLLTTQDQVARTLAGIADYGGSLDVVVDDAVPEEVPA